MLLSLLVVCDTECIIGKMGSEFECVLLDIVTSSLMVSS